MEAELGYSGHRLFIFANHWPSRGNPESDRIKAAETLRKRVDEILKANPAADSLIEGELNDEPSDVSIVEMLRAKKKPTGDELLNTVMKSAGSYYYQKKLETINQIIVSPGMLDAKAFRWKADSPDRAVVLDNQLYTPRKNINIRTGRPGRTGCIRERPSPTRYSSGWWRKSMVLTFRE